MTNRLHIPELFQDLMALIGSPVASPKVQSLKTKLDDEPVVTTTERTLSYGFKKHGLVLTFLDDSLVLVIIHVLSPNNPRGNQSLSINLPGGLCAADTRSDVERKLGREPFLCERIQGRTPEDIKDYWDYYYIGRCMINTICKGETQLLSSLSIRKYQPHPPMWIIRTYNFLTRLFQSVPAKLSPSSIAVLELAKQEARKNKFNFLGTEHILLGLIAHGDSNASRLLAAHGVALDAAREQVRLIVGTGSSEATNIAFTPAARQTVKFATKWSRQLNYPAVEPEYLLFAILDGGEGVAVRVLENLGIDRHDLCEHLHKFL